MSPVVFFPDVVTVGLEFLRAELPAYSEVPVVETVPNPRPDALVQLRPAGGVATWPALDSPRLDVLIWHQDTHRAVLLAQIVRGLLLHHMPGFGPVRKVRDFLGPTRNPDPDSGAARVLLSVEIVLRGTPA